MCVFVCAHSCLLVRVGPRVCQPCSISAYCQLSINDSMVEMLHPSVCLICVHCSNYSKNLFSVLKIQNMSRENFYEPKLSFPTPHNLSVPNRWERLGAPATRNISSLQTLSDFSEDLCHMTTGVREQRAIWPIRRGGDSVGQIGRYAIGCRPGLCGCHP